MLHTPRCLIRPFRPKDLTPFMAYRNDLQWMRYQGFCGLSRGEYAAFLLENRTLEEGIQLAVVCRKSHRLLGDLYLRREGETLWVGCTIRPARARQGFAREALGGVLGAAPVLGIQRVCAETEPANLPSAALLESLDFRETGTRGGLRVFEREVSPQIP